MSTEENSVEFDEEVNGWIVKYRCPNCGRKYKVILSEPKNKKVQCNFCKYIVKLTVRQNSVSVS